MLDKIGGVASALGVASGVAGGAGGGTITVATITSTAPGLMGAVGGSIPLSRKHAQGWVLIQQAVR